MVEAYLPITGICLVSKPNNVPTGYQCIRKVFDDINRDADLMPDSLLERKDRFLCITRMWPLADNRMMVLEDIKLIGEREIPPPNYTALTHTIDTHEKGTSKRFICVKMVDRQSGLKCICDVVFLYRSKRPPSLYTTIGEINGLQMCIKEGTVPVSRPAPPVPSAQSNPYPSGYHTSLQQNNYQPTSQQHYPISDYSNTNTLSKKSDEKEILDGIPFSINPKYLKTINNHDDNGLAGLESFNILSANDIEQYFRYDFDRERAYLS